MKKARIRVNDMTLAEIADKYDLSLETVRHRYSRGEKSFAELSRPTNHKRNWEKKIYCAWDSGTRLLDVIEKKGISRAELSRKTGVSKSAIYSFLYEGVDISSMRLAKLCAACGVSMDYIMGIKVVR